MNKQELIRLWPPKGGLRVTNASRVVNAVGELLQICLAEGERITWSGVSSFFTREGLAGDGGEKLRWHGFSR